MPLKLKIRTLFNTISIVFTNRRCEILKYKLWNILIYKSLHYLPSIQGIRRCGIYVFCPEHSELSTWWVIRRHWLHVCVRLRMCHFALRTFNSQIFRCQMCQQKVFLYISECICDNGILYLVTRDQLFLLSCLKLLLDAYELFTLTRQFCVAYPLSLWKGHNCMIYLYLVDGIGADISQNTILRRLFMESSC